MRHVVWDWNGTLLDDLAIVVAAVNHALDDPDVVHVDEEIYRTHYRRPVRLFYEELLGRPIAADEWAQLDDRYHSSYRLGLEAARLAADAVEALELAGQRGLTQSLLSMWRHDELLPLVRRFGIGWAFERVDGLRGPGGGEKAPHLRSHLEALPFEVDPSEVLVIGDTFDDAAAAGAVGATCVLYDGGSHHRRELEAAGVPVVDRLVDAFAVGWQLAGRA